MTHYAERLHHDPLNRFEDHVYPESFRDLDLLAEEDAFDHHHRQNQFHRPNLHRDPLLSHHSEFGDHLGYHHSHGLMNHFDHPSSHFEGLRSHLPLTQDHLHHHDLDLDLHGYNPSLVDDYYHHIHNLLPHHSPYYDQHAFMGYNGLGGMEGIGMGGIGYGAGLGYGTEMGYGAGLGYGAGSAYGSDLGYGTGIGMGRMMGMDPFVDGIHHDYGYGHVPPLSSYGLSPNGFPPSHGPILDDLYLFELMLRSDRLLTERERLNRWEERMRWEELNEIERENQWKEMSLIRRAQLGLAGGSYWASQLGGIPINDTLGYHHMIPRIGTRLGFAGQPHYGLSSALATRFPMWGVGGLGMGRRISSHYLRPRHLIRQANIRRDYAERRGEIPPRPRIVGPGLMGTGVPAQYSTLGSTLGLMNSPRRVRSRMIL
ncbi:hypothetical protein DFH28DRAFT_972692 [Melampsora americana]|nr:hypothetical protein DFH28DRAFT_972692 [Melampsora americana]